MRNWWWIQLNYKVGYFYVLEWLKNIFNYPSTGTRELQELSFMTTN